MRVQHQLDLICDTSQKGCNIRVENNGINLIVYCSNDLYKILSRLRNHHSKIIEILSRCSEYSSDENWYIGSYSGFNLSSVPHRVSSVTSNTSISTATWIPYNQVTIPVEFILPENTNDCLAYTTPEDKIK